MTKKKNSRVWGKDKEVSNWDNDSTVLKAFVSGLFIGIAIGLSIGMIIFTN